MRAEDLRGLHLGHQVCYNGKVWRVRSVQEPRSGCNPFDTEVLTLLPANQTVQLNSYVTIVLAELHRVSRLQTAFPDLTKLKL